MSFTRKFYLGIPLSLAALLFSAVGEIAAGDSSGSGDLAEDARLALGVWDIDDNEPFGRVPNGVNLHIWNEPSEGDLEFALANPDVQKLITAHRLASLDVPSLALLGERFKRSQSARDATRRSKAPLRGRRYRVER
jgi:hypothetical protein